MLAISGKEKLSASQVLDRLKAKDVFRPFKEYEKKYRELHKIGEGGFGRAFTVKNKKGTVYVAKKQINYNEKDYEDFRKEAEFLQKI